jgi:nucleoside-diphosphate-sugar epimerase
VLVVGTGYVGRRFLERHGRFAVLGLSRSAVQSRQPIRTYDLDAGGELPLLLPNRYTVLYTVPPSSRSKGDVRLAGLLGRLTPAPQRFVYISTTGVYGNRDGERVDEDSPVNAESGRAKKRVAAEDLLRSWGAQHDCDVVILRVPGIYGPDRLGIERVRDGLPVITEKDAGPGNRIHVDDLVSCCDAAVGADSSAGIYNVGDGDHRSSTWFSNEVARQCGLEPPPTISMAEAERVFSPMRLSFLRESRRVDTQKMRDVLGVTPRYQDPADGIRASIAEDRTALQGGVPEGIRRK